MLNNLTCIGIFIVDAEKDCIFEFDFLFGDFYVEKTIDCDCDFNEPDALKKRSFTIIKLQSL